MVQTMDGRHAETVRLSTLGANLLPARESPHLVQAYRTQRFSTGVPRREADELFGAVSAQNMAAGRLVDDIKAEPRHYHNEARQETRFLNGLMRDREVLVRQDDISGSRTAQLDWGVVENVDYNLYGGANGKPAIFIRLKKDELGEARTIVIAAHEEHTIRVFKTREIL
ncbi:MAG: hypothetical protein HYU97_02190 [Deltaproteobacteria bacterium]|nr:hypothetical protein [Deltaproteobacteria bacterium]